MEKQAVNAGQQVETNAYVPTYKVKPEFKQAVLKAIGDRPFNEIAGLINAVNVETVDHNTLNQVAQALGQFPYIKVEGLITNLHQYVEQVVEDEDEKSLSEA